MAVNLSPFGGVGAQFLDNSGNVLTGGKIFTYAAGTTTNQATYTSSLGNTPLPNPIILNAAGRVPTGEIWLTDGLIYKFVLTDSNDVLIATYDNITGINSNFVAFTNEQEIQTATAGQTVFNLTTITYQTGTNSLSVFVDGVNQYGPGAQYAYLETNSNTVTFVNGLHVGAQVKFTTSALTTSNATNASVVAYDPPFTGAVSTNVEDKLAQTVSVYDFGAVGDGVHDDTNAFKAALDYVKTLPWGRPIVLDEGPFLITDTLVLDSARQAFLGNKTVIIFTPSTGNKDCIYVGNPANPGPPLGDWLYNCVIKDVEIRSTTGFNGLVGIHTQATSNMILEDINLYGFYGTNCKGLFIEGAEMHKAKRIQIFASYPIYITRCDFATLSDTYLVATATTPCVFVETAVDNFLMDGNNVWAIFSHGFYWDQASAVNPKLCLNVKIANVRAEQEKDINGYIIWINRTNGLQNLILENIYGGNTTPAGTSCNGIYLKTVYDAHIYDFRYVNGSGIGLVLSNDCDLVKLTSCSWIPGSTINVGSLKTIESFSPLLGQIPTDALFALSYGERLTQEQATSPTITLAPDAIYQITRDSFYPGAEINGVLVVTSGDGSSALIAVRFNKVTNLLVQDAANRFSVTAGNASTINVYRSAAGVIDIQNKTSLTQSLTYSLLGKLQGLPPPI
jgi:hypothetical protein